VCSSGRARCWRFLSFVFVRLRRPPRSTLFPYTRSSDLGRLFMLQRPVSMGNRPPTRHVPQLSGASAVRLEELEHVGAHVVVAEPQHVPAVADAGSPDEPGVWSGDRGGELLRVGAEPV